MSETAVEPHVLFSWACGPVDAVADELKSAYSTLTKTSEDGGLSAAGGGSQLAAMLATITGHDGGWGQDDRYIRGRVYDFAGALMGAGHDYESGDVAGSDALEQAWDRQYGPGAEPAELGDSQPYRD